jgi:RNA polymerase-binding transcription factor DksA
VAGCHDQNRFLKGVSIMGTDTMAVSGNLGTNSRRRSAKTRSAEMQDVREVLIVFLSKSSRSPKAHIESIQVSELHPCNQIDVANQLFEHHNQAAIGAVLTANVVTAKNIISMIDQGWEGDCTKCGNSIPTKRICCALSAYCIECASKK